MERRSLSYPIPERHVTLYNHKPKFLAALRPIGRRLERCGVTANQVTVFAAFGSIALGGFVAVNADISAVFLLVPFWFFVRMALNALDGMLAREFDQKSSLGAYLNEIADVVSDAALYVPFAFIAPFNPLWVGVVILLANLSEFAGALGPMIGASRRYEGPMGKSDRAVVFGGLGLAVGIMTTLPQWTTWIMPGLALLLCLTIFNRIRGGLRDAAMRKRHGR